ncbi:rhomboid family intramembrane serine protease GlpG [Thaumasiovibrio sp. DFM-14]|uniref:rhomboid family intramembrane serine protease GlpG n=1 Tax=Thaumasiovibrio sp. DFM-14 TaxID=3384792 RepID=UPI00399F72FA
MLKLYVMRHARQAQAFIDYCDSRGLALTLAPDVEGAIAIWVVNEDHWTEAEAELRYFLQHPYDAKYQAASWQMADSRTAKFSYASPNLMQLLQQGAGPFTLLVLLMSVTVYLLWWLGFQNALFRWLHFPVDATQYSSLWRWVTHAIMHFSVLHLAFNCLWWWLLGGEIERKFGAKKLILLFICASVMSGVGQFWVSGVNFGGLSGVVYALLGYCWWMGWLAPQRGLFLPKPYIGFMLVWLVMGYVMPMFNIANTAHLVGLITGCLVAFIDSQRGGEATR